MICIKDFGFFKRIFDPELQDLSDTLNCIITPGILFLFCSIISFKSYVFSPIHCFSSSSPNVMGYDKFVEAYCWVKGTINIDGRTPTKYEDRSHLRKIGYYQWIPIILLIQIILYYLPNMIWKVICRHNNGTDMSNIIKKAVDLASNSTNIEKTNEIISNLEEMFFIHRDFRQDCISKLKRKIYKICKFCIISKRLATKLSMNYILVKLLYLVNGVGQIYLMKTFLNIDNWFTESYGKIFNLMSEGSDWAESKYFPRVSFCYVDNIRTLGVTDNTYISQCVLSINMLNEKIFIFLFLWYTFVLFVTFLSLVTWIFHLGSRSHQVNQIKNYLMMRQNYKKMDELLIERFIEHFLRVDGMFLLNMIRGSAGDLVTSSITNGLYKTYFQKYRHQKFNNDKSNIEVESLSLKLERGGKGSVKMCSNNASAPDSKDYII